MPATQFIQPTQGRQSITATAKPITQITTTSGTPTYTSNRVTDSVAWDLSNVEVGYVAEATDSNQIYTGVITEINDGNNYVVIQGWIRGGVRSSRGSSLAPSDGTTCIIHKIDKCRRLLIDALDDNSNSVFVGFTSSVAISGANAGHPIPKTATQPNHRLVIEMGANVVTGIDEYLDLKRTYVIGTGGDEISWIAM